MIENIEVHKALLNMMMSEYWAVDNNRTCAGATIVFLRGLGFDKTEISNIVEEWVDITQEELDEVEMDMKAELVYYQE